MISRAISSEASSATLGGVECDDADRVIELPDIRSEIMLSRSARSAAVSGRRGLAD
jgi:hypothetical protein